MSKSDSLQTQVYNNPFSYKNIVYPKAFTNPEILHRCEEFQFLQDDILVVTYPRSGTTLTQEIVWQIVNHERIRRNENYGQTFHRFPCLEFNLSVIEDQMTEPTLNGIDNLSLQKSNRLIKTHLPFSLIRNQFEKVNLKMIFVIRNPKDNVVSCYNFHKGVKFIYEDVSFSDYLQAHMTSKSIFGNFFDVNLEYWSLRHRQNVLIVRYEDIIYQPFQEVHKIALFLGFSLSAEKIATIVHNTTFDVMSENEAINRTLASGKHKFCRKGKVGDWKDWFSFEQDRAVSSWIAERLEGETLQFIYE